MFFVLDRRMDETRKTNLTNSLYYRHVPPFSHVMSSLSSVLNLHLCGHYFYSCILFFHSIRLLTNVVFVEKRKWRCVRECLYVWQRRPNEKKMANDYESVELFLFFSFFFLHDFNPTGNCSEGKYIDKLSELRQNTYLSKLMLDRV